MKIISKTKPKGTEYNELKNMKKAKRIVKAKEDRRRAENKRVNAEARKERRIEGEFYDRVREVEILGFNKEMLEMVGYGVVMKNAEEDLKKDAKYLTDSNDNDGVYKFLVQKI